jgi:hypothetical protein
MKRIILFIVVSTLTACTPDNNNTQEMRNDSSDNNISVPSSNEPDSAMRDHTEVKLDTLHP